MVRTCLLSLIVLGGLLGPAVRAAEPVSFGTEVMAVLSKAGCNQGTCHGALNGKNGFKLSLRGEDPVFDWIALTREQLGRRVNLHNPEQSLLLQKATAVMPHEGGRRFTISSPEYELLRAWIAAGAAADAAGAPRLTRLLVTPAEQVLVEPATSVQLRATAFFSDGRSRDVTSLAAYEASNELVGFDNAGGVHRREGTGSGVQETTVLVRFLDQHAVVRLAFVPARPVPPVLQEALKPIDQHVFARLRQLRLEPSEPCNDSVFLRRVFLDLLGVLPTAVEAHAFLDDRRPDKRPRLVEQLLERPEFADFWALKWADLLRVEEKTLDAKGVRSLHGWLRQCIAEGRPLHLMAREIIAGQGSTYVHPQANFYRALRNPQDRAEAVAQVFLGVRVQCARCHNHPFDQWKQDDYHSLAACFARIEYRIVENNRRDRFDKHEFDGEQVVWQNRSGEVAHPRTGQPVTPRILGGGPVPSDADRLQALAEQVASPSNPYFVRTQVNRIWYHLLGRGIVDPIDDFRLTNPPANPVLLDFLCQEFVEHDCDLRHVVRLIATSRTYQLSAVPNDSNATDETHFSHAAVRRLSAEVLLDALAQVTEVPVRFNGYPLGVRATQLPGVQQFRSRERAASDGETFLKMFGKPERLLSCECERSDDATLVQAFRNLTGEPLNQMLAEPANRLGRLLASGASDAAILEDLFLSSLSRRPAGDEQKRLLEMVARAADRRQAWEDVLWGLLNSKEFLLRQ